MRIIRVHIVHWFSKQLNYRISFLSSLSLYLCGSKWHIIRARQQTGNDTWRLVHVHYQTSQLTKLAYINGRSNYLSVPHNLQFISLCSAQSVLPWIMERRASRNRNQTLGSLRRTVVQARKVPCACTDPTSITLETLVKSSRQTFRVISIIHKWFDVSCQQRKEGSIATRKGDHPNFQILINHRRPS